MSLVCSFFVFRFNCENIQDVTHNCSKLKQAEYELESTTAFNPHSEDNSRKFNEKEDDLSHKISPTMCSTTVFTNDLNPSTPITFDSKCMKRQKIASGTFCL